MFMFCLGIRLPDQTKIRLSDITSPRRLTAAWGGCQSHFSQFLLLFFLNFCWLLDRWRPRSWPCPQSSDWLSVSSTLVLQDLCIDSEPVMEHAGLQGPETITPALLQWQVKMAAIRRACCLVCVDSWLNCTQNKVLQKQKCNQTV